MKGRILNRILQQINEFQCDLSQVVFFDIDAEISATDIKFIEHPVRDRIWHGIQFSQGPVRYAQQCDTALLGANELLKPGLHTASCINLSLQFPRRSSFAKQFHFVRSSGSNASAEQQKPDLKETINGPKITAVE